MDFVFDGTYIGLMSTVFEAFERKCFQVKVYSSKHYQASFFEEFIPIVSDLEEYERVLKGLKKILSTQQVSDFYRAYLSEDPKAWQCIFDIIVNIYKGQHHFLDNFGDEQVLYFSQTLKKVSRERHRMKAFIRFSKSEDGMYFAVIEPDFNVLPLIISFFKNRYADQSWMIYDLRRDYGIHYDNSSKKIEEIQLLPVAQQALQTSATMLQLDEEEALYQQLWQRYFKSTNIEARRNMKLHIQHVPKRYWKYLIEKQIQ